MQTAAVCVNAVLVVVWMIRSFRLYVLPGFPGNLDNGTYALTTVHAVVGLIGVVLGVFLVIRGNQLMASGRSLARYKTAMRVAYLVYMAGTVLGVVLYVGPLRLSGRQLRGSNAGAPRPAGGPGDGSAPPTVACCC